MTKHFTWLALLLVLFASLISCSKETPKEEEPEYYTAAQKEAFKMMHGSFTSDFYSVILHLTFDAQYSKPYETTFEDGAKTEIHGELTNINAAGVSYKYYYRLYPDAKRIALYSKKESIKTVILHDFQIIDSDTFKWKYTDSVMWETYIRDK